MRFSFYWAVYLTLVVSIGTVVGQDINKTKSITPSPKKQNSTNDKLNNDRNKRSLDEDGLSFWASRGKKLHTYVGLASDDKSTNDDPMDKEPPFWGNRGRRDDSASIENNFDVNPPLFNQLPDNDDDNTLSKGIRDGPDSLFWGNRGRRDPGDDDDVNLPFWGNRGRRQEDDPIRGAQDRREDELPFWGSRGRRYNTEKQDNNIPEETPFWGNRGRREEGKPFWGSRGRRDEEQPFWGNRGRRDDIEPFWGNRGRRDDIEPFWGNRGRRDDIEPFWGNRGRRDDIEPFWGNRGRRDEVEPFWGNRGRRDEVEPFWGSRGRRESKNRHKDHIKKILSDAIHGVEEDIESLARSRRGANRASSFWKNRDKEEIKLLNIFKLYPHRFQRRGLNGSKHSQSRTVLDDRIYAEEPHYILVERSSRASSEDDPFFISRGKKMFVASEEYPLSARDRRGSLEDLVKSVRNDPYYIARGKKDMQDNVTNNSSFLLEDWHKAKEMICATVDMILYNKGNNIKRETDDNNSDRDRRTILKKLAVQLQMDPYFASRGKKNESEFNDDNLKDFINEVSVKCN
ncbi:hypothetical protein NE865_03181 [Phthorimaea operculella]|nr:hypothetical protein NE865_03181 [Phthorimaea operculella]